MQQLSAQDAQFLYMETNKSLSHVTSVGIFDPSTAPNGRVRFKQIIEHVRGRLNTSPIYKRRLYHVPMELDFPYWVEDEHFDIEYHIRHNRLPHPADWRQFCIHLARFHSRPLDMQRAPWEMYVIEGLDHLEGIPKGCYAVATKIHHAAADGMAIVKLFTGLYDQDNQGTPLNPEPPRVSSKRYVKPSFLQMSARGLIHAAKSPLEISKSLSNNAPAIMHAVREKIAQRRQPSPPAVPSTRFNLETSPHRVFDATLVSMEDLSKIRRLVSGATINDVVLAICSGALRRYLAKHKELPAESLRAFAPVNVRRKAKANQSHDDEPGNNISTISPALYTNLEDPVARLQAIHIETTEQKAARKGIAARLLTDLTQKVPASTQMIAARILLSSEAAGRMTNLCISNVPGPPIPVYMNGARCLHAYGMGPLADRMGLFIAVTSYAGEMSINATSCRRTMPDIDFFMACIRDSFAEYLKLASSATSDKPERLKKAAPVQKQRASKKAVATKKRTSKKKMPANRKKRVKKVSTKKASAE